MLFDNYTQSVAVGNGRDRRSSTKHHVLVASTVRALCRAYHLDVCCLQASFTARCNALGANVCDNSSFVPPAPLCSWM